MLKLFIIDHAHFVLLNQDVLRRDKEVRDESPRLTREENDTVVLVILVHGLFDRCHVCFGRAIVPRLPVM